MGLKSDIEIAQECQMEVINTVADRLAIDDNYVENYGKYKAKIDYRMLKDYEDKPNGKLILVTAINPTPAGEGKTTTTVGLGDSLTSLGKKTVVALREPSLGAQYSASRAVQPAAATLRSYPWRISICILLAICTP